VTGTKVISAMPMLGLATALAIMAVAAARRGDRQRARRLGLVVAGVVGAFLVVFLGWTALQGLRGQDGWVNPLSHIAGRELHGLPVDELLGTSFSGLQLVTSYYLQPQVTGESVVLWARLLGALVTAAPLLALLAFAPRSPRWVVGAITLGGLLAFPLVSEAQVYLQNDQYLPTVAGRYGLSFVPWAFACLALVAADRRLVRTAAATVAAGAAVMLLAVSGVWTLS
jgi:hypothetical protein